MLMSTPAFTQHPPEHQDLHKKFYSGWNRPAGYYEGVKHRKQSCCNETDCFPVLETKMIDGQYYVKPDYPLVADKSTIQWYPVPSELIESKQEDPRFTPDGRSHVCIMSVGVVCFVEGSGS